jgi:hypothetical protein
MNSSQIEGYCRPCASYHRLGPGNTITAALKIMTRLEREETIDLFSGRQDSDETLSTSHLLGASRGKMFGVLEVCTQKGQSDFLYAFSGQYNSRWLVEGWVPPVFDIAAFTQLTVDTEKEIKSLTARISELSRTDEKWLKLRKERKLLSRTLMREIEKLYEFVNYRGEKRGLADAFTGPKGIPTGTGDCCAPKLLHFAAKNNLHPVGLCEFFWGRETRSRSYHHGEFSNPCVERCQPILGFLLCGIEEL